MSDEPKEIWAITQYRGVFGATGTWREVGSNDGRTPYIRADAPELLAMVEALREATSQLASVTGADDRPESDSWYIVTDARAAITAWEKLTK